MIKKLTTPKSTTYTIGLSDFSKGVNKQIDENLLSLSYAQNAYNIRTDNKALKNGYGFKELSMPNSKVAKENVYKVPTGTTPLAMWERKVADEQGNLAELILLYCSDKKLYFAFAYGAVSTFFDSGVTFEETPVLLTYVYNGLDTVVMASPSDKLCVWNGATPTASELNLHLNSLCAHYERLFASTSDNTSQIRFSKDFEILNWTESGDNGGFINLADERGKVNKVLSFNDYVYIVREHGLSRLSAYGDQSDFSITHISQTSNRIFANTAVLCGDRIVMLASDGLHYVVDSTLYKYDFKINTMLDLDALQYATACYFNNKYYLAVRLNFKDGKTIGCENEADYHNNVLIEFDLNTQVLNIVRGVDICSLCPIVFDQFSKLAVCFHGENSGTLGELVEEGFFLDKPLPKLWKTPTSDLNIATKKVVKEVKVLTDADLNITVNSESETQTLKVSPSPHQQELLCNVVGNRVGVEFSTTANNFNISNPQLVIDALPD